MRQTCTGEETAECHRFFWCRLKDKRNSKPGSLINHKAPSTKRHLSTLPIQSMLRLRCVLGRVLWSGSQVNHRAASNLAGSPTPKQGPQKYSDPGYQFTIMNNIAEEQFNASKAVLCGFEQYSSCELRNRYQIGNLSNPKYEETQNRN